MHHSENGADALDAPRTARILVIDYGNEFIWSAKDDARLVYAHRKRRHMKGLAFTTSYRSCWVRDRVSESDNILRSVYWCDFVSLRLTT